MVISNRPKNFTATKYSKICSDHFLISDFKSNIGGSYRLDLNENAVPSIFTCTEILLVKRSKLLNQRNADSFKSSESESVASSSNSLVFRSPSSSVPKEIDTLLTTTSSTSKCIATSTIQLLKTPSKARVVLFSPPTKRQSLRSPNTPRKKSLCKKIKLLQQTIQRKNIIIKNLTDLIVSMKKNGLIDANVEGILFDKFDGLSKELFQNQLINEGREPTGMRYSKEIEEFALTVNYYSPKALTYCRYLNASQLLLFYLIAHVYYHFSITIFYCILVFDFTILFYYLCSIDWLL